MSLARRAAQASADLERERVVEFQDAYRRAFKAVAQLNSFLGLPLQATFAAGDARRALVDLAVASPEGTGLNNIWGALEMAGGLGGVGPTGEVSDPRVETIEAAAAAVPEDDQSRPKPSSVRPAPAVGETKQGSAGSSGYACAASSAASGRVPLPTEAPGAARRWRGKRMRPRRLDTKPASVRAVIKGPRPPAGPPPPVAAGPRPPPRGRRRRGCCGTARIHDGARG